MPNNLLDTHPADIKADLAKRGLTLADLSRAAGYHPTAASVTLKKPWPAMERAIAKALGRPAKDIWPSRYDSSGTAHSARRSGKHNMAGGRRNVQSTRAA